MGFGFVVARFGLFLERLLIMESATRDQSSGLSLWFGTALIVAGILVNAFAGWHHIRLVRQLDSGELAHSRSSLQALRSPFFLAVAGLVMAIILFLFEALFIRSLKTRRRYP
jgi:putative membrane protein